MLLLHNAQPLQSYVTIMLNLGFLSLEDAMLTTGEASTSVCVGACAHVRPPADLPLSRCSVWKCERLRPKLSTPAARHQQLMGLNPHSSCAEGAEWRGP